MKSAVLFAIFAALAPPAAYGDSLREQLLGTWTLVSWTRTVGGVEEPDRMMGADPVGQFMFSPDGRMCFTAMRRDRVKFQSADLRAGTADEKTAAYDSYIGYCGRYEVNEEERAVLLRLDVSSFPNWTGTSQKRMVEVTGSRLRVRTPPIDRGARQIVTTVLWERAK